MKTTTLRRLGCIGLTAACAGALAACGGDDAAAITGGDGGGDDVATLGDGGAGVDGSNPGDSSTHPDGGGNQDGATSDAPSGDDGGDAALPACDAPTAGTFYVDPVNGSDTDMGSGTAAGSVAGRCAFKTITKALQAAGTPSTATSIHVLGASTASDGETFPLVVPANVTIDSSGGAVTVALPAASLTNAFTLASPTSALIGLTIDGTAAAGSTNGILVQAGAAASTFVREVEVKGFGAAGIEVGGSAAFTIQAGTSVHDNGGATGTGSKAGLHVTGTATVTANIASGSDEVSFATNHGEGVLVDSTASIAFTGVPGTGGAGTVVAHDNGTNGITITQTANGIATPPASTLTGVVLWHNTNEGAQFFGGSVVTVRGSMALYNGDNGILVLSAATASITGNPLANIDLGSASNGLNTLQATTNGNGAAGVCNAANGTALVAAALNAQGNTFDGHDCSMAASSSVTLSSNNCATGSGVDIGIKGTDATISTTHCAQ